VPRPRIRQGVISIGADEGASDRSIIASSNIVPLPVPHTHDEQLIRVRTRAAWLQCLKRQTLTSSIRSRYRRCDGRAIAIRYWRRARFSRHMRKCSTCRKQQTGDDNK
ncbi:hypothetical protein COV94_04250, partial [Candidatus Woesearchaeota archaeon CG11_big_fil_rev_8_21_14_0_20_57_5]